MSKLQMHHPFHEGSLAREFGAKRTDNPYNPGTDEHYFWDQGWGAVDDLEDEDKASPSRDTRH
jgi:hypothetical protein